MRVIPAGTKEFSFPLQQISLVRFTHKRSILLMIIFILLALFSFGFAGVEDGVIPWIAGIFFWHVLMLLSKEHLG